MSVDDNTIAIDYRLAMATDKDVINLFYGTAIHEASHSGESSKSFGKLKAYIREKMGTEAFDKAVEEMKNEREAAGEKLSYAKAENEVIAEYVRTKMFSSISDMVEFVNRDYTTAMSIQDRAKDIWNAVKGMFGGEADKIEDGLRLFERVLATRGTAEAGGTANYIRYGNSGNPDTVVITEDIFKGHENEPPHKVIRDYLREHIGEYATIIESGQKVYLGDDLPGEYTHSKYTQRLSRNKQNIKGQAAQNLTEIIETATEREWSKNTEEKHKIDAKYGWYKYKTNVSVKGKEYTATILIRNDADGKKYLYDVFINNQGQNPSTSNRTNDSVVNYSTPDDNNISQSKNIVNSQYMQNQKNNSEKTGMQLALEKAGIDKNTFSNGANSINALTPEQRQAMQDMRKAGLLLKM